MTVYDTLDVPVRGGDLRVGRWRSDEDVAEPLLVLAVHGITANHTAWWPVARLLTATPGVEVLAPDLRGRGLSAGLPGPWGMTAHADDLYDVLAGRPAVVVGHSMGGFVGVDFAAAHPGLTRRLVLVDGGIPLPLPEGVTAEQATVAGLGPALARLSMTFASLAAYRALFENHPALGPIWGEDAERYVDYDFADGHSRVSADAVAQDSGELYDTGPVPAAWEQLAGPVAFLRAPRGLMAEPPGMYPPAVVAAWAAAHPALRPRDVEGVDHYSITLDDRGAAAVADEVLRR